MRGTFVTLLTLFVLLSNSGHLYSDTDIDQGKVEFENNNFALAKQYFLAGLRRNPDSAEAKIGLIKIYRQDGRNYEIAGDLLRQVLESDPSNIEALRLQGEMHYTKGEWALASASYKKLLSVSPDDYAAHISLSIIFRELGDYEGARLLSENMKKMHQPVNSNLQKQAAP